MAANGPKYLVLGFATEEAMKGGMYPVVVSTHYSLYDAVKCCLAYVEKPEWFHCFVAKYIK